ncbi:MAG: hypothetical protein IKP22_02555 [Clostridia bacterium]|nr:hypothetical protein [Clostridia bacterium]
MKKNENVFSHLIEMAPMMCYNGGDRKNRTPQAAAVPWTGAPAQGETGDIG